MSEMWVEYRALSEIAPAPRNAKEHDIPLLHTSMDRWGYTQPMLVNEYTGNLLGGHGRLETLQQKKADGEPAPERVESRDGEWYVPVIRGVSFEDDADAEAYLIADNRTVEAGGWDEAALLDILQGYTEEERAGTGYSDDDISQLLASVTGKEHEGEEPRDIAGVDLEARPNPRNLPFDFIYTWNAADASCCLAVMAGLKYGLQSKPTYRNNYKRVCPYHTSFGGRHAVTFVDNDFAEYDHHEHLSVVKELRPKYATVRDIMSREQCSEAGIEYYSFEQIMRWAAELEQYADNVIVIPKYDCLDDIPERYVLGYSIPTSHGGTPIPASRFKGRPIHLLGGSWHKQLAFLAELGEDVVSVDNNYIGKTASTWGVVTGADGEAMQLYDLGLGRLTNPRYAALALSFGLLGAKVAELNQTGMPEDLGIVDDEEEEGPAHEH